MSNKKDIQGHVRIGKDEQGRDEQKDEGYE